MKLLKAKTIFTSDGDKIIKDGAVLVGDKGKIEYVGPVGEMPPCPDAEVVDYGDATLLPGLIDMHVHVGYWQTKSDGAIYAESPGMMALLAADEMKSCFTQGVTTIRQCADSPEGLGHVIKTGLAKGFIDGPRFITCNKAITSTGGHAYLINIEADGEDAVRKAVRQQIKDGADWIKLMASHRDGNSQMTQAEITAAVDETHNWGKKCCVHAGSEKSIEYSINAGMDTIEHGTFMTVEQARRCREKGIAWVPTIIAYTTNMESAAGFMKAIAEKPAEERSILEQQVYDEQYPYISAAAQQYKDTFAQLMETGITIATGTDMIFEALPLTPVGEEMLYMHKYGMEAMETVKCATSTAAEILGIENETGRVKAGLEADLLVVDGDLTADINNIKNISAVYRKGRLVHSKAQG